MKTDYSPRLLCRVSGLRGRILASHVGGESGDPSTVAGQNNDRKDVMRRGSLASPQSKKPRLSDVTDAGDGSDMEQCLPAGKECAACVRVTGRDASFYNPEAPVAWLYADGRGGLCKDCGTVYRQVYRSTMCQPTFLTFLQEHRVEYLGVLLAYVSLRK